MSTREHLIKQLELLDELEGRYTNLKYANFDPSRGEHRGCFSIVFRAFDKLLSKDVAIKFYDPSPANVANTYRFKAFEREPLILMNLLQKTRCLQLVSGAKVFVVDVLVVGGGKIEIPCHYFVVEWIDEQIDDYFELQNSVESVVKLKLFHEISMAVAALHRHSVHHRDLKADNLRLKMEKSEETIVAIDLGAAARSEDPALQDEYKRHMGADFYASPEAAHCFSGDRELGPFTDIYALGCLLFELFNSGFHYVSLREVNTYYDHACAGIVSEVQIKKNRIDRLKAWRSGYQTYKHLLQPISINQIGSSVPDAISNELDGIFKLLTEFDFSERLTDFSFLSNRIHLCIRILQNRYLEKKMREQRKIRRKLRIEKLKKKQHVEMIGLNNSQGGINA